jgi:site-specific DNA-methyltransferase (adenine-specific)
MTPYYSDELVTLYHGDCRDILPGLPSASYVTITDPPYQETSLKWDRWVDGWPGLVAKLSSSMWSFGSFRMFLDRASEFVGWKFAQEIVWEKHNGSNACDDRFRRMHELIAQFYREDVSWKRLYKKVPVTMDANKRTVRRKGRVAHWGRMDASIYTSIDGGPRLMGSVLFCRSCHGYAIHPTQKPEGVVRPLVEYSIGPGDVALDPFAGSGTTLRVCKDLGVPVVGIEANEEDCEKIVGRLSQQALSLEEVDHA